jgi:hypothetical protein
MIGLTTADESMTSHRWGFINHDCRDGFMYSEHTPFSNDPETKIETFLKPIDNGWHLRIHRVKLSRQYKICEGGFSIGLWDDWRKSEQKGDLFSLWNRKLISRMSTAASVNIKYDVKKPQPGMHLLAPFAVYPAYSTELLSAGEYYFVSVFGIHDIGTEISVPEIKLDGDTVSLCGETVFKF